nr:kinetochore scaffold 1 isoform X2 [Scatophagus argus]
MEPLDPAKNDESSGFSKRRISSILKAPRKSTRFPDPEQQENVVECAKPAEKRNSRRVSFAPANNVLLFSSDVKNASPARSPLQDLMTTSAATQNRVQVAHTEDGIQQITGMETLLNAPLHASQQRDKVNFDTGNDFGEKTVMFSTDDAFMDMTHCQTINIANDAQLLPDISHQNYAVFPSSRDKTVMFTADEGSMDMTLSHTVNLTSGSVSLPTCRSTGLNAETRNISSSVPCLDPEFENFLASIFKPSHPGVNPVITSVTLPAGASSEETSSSQAQHKTQTDYVDKENQAPTSVSAAMEKSLNASRKTRSYGSVLCQKDDVSMDMTVAHTGRIQGFTDDDGPCQGQEVHSHPNSRVSQTTEKTKQQQSSKMLASFNPKDMTSSTNSALHASHQRHKVSLDTKDECREKTIMFTAGDEFMDMTQSHTVNISSGSLAPPNQNRTCGKRDNASSLEERKRETCGLPSSSASGLDPGFQNFLASLSKTSVPNANAVPPGAASSKETVDTYTSLTQLKTDAGEENQSRNAAVSPGGSFNGGAVCSESDVSMDMTEAQTGRITGPSGSDDPCQFLFPIRDMKRTEITSGQAPGSSNSADMEASLKPVLKTKILQRSSGHQVKFDAEDACSEKTVRFSADDACMDVTQSHTVNIAADFPTQDVSPQNNRLKKAAMASQQQRSEALRSSDRKGMETSLTASSKVLLQRHQVKFDAEDDCREKTVRFTADEACMDVTQSHTVNIVSDLEMHLHQNMDFLPSCGEKTVRFTASDAAMEVTQSHTVNIATGFDPQSHHKVGFLPGGGEKTVRFTADDAAMDVTRSHTVNIAADFDPQSHHKVDFLPGGGEKTVRFSANDAAMDVTQSHTVNIVSDSVTESVLPHRDSNILSFRENMDFPPPVKKRENESCFPLRSRPSSAHTLHTGFKNSLCRTSGPWANPVITTAAPAAVSSHETASTNGSLDQPKMQKPDVDTEKEAPDCVSAVVENPVNKTVADSPEGDVRMDMTETQTNHILGQSCTDEPPHCPSSTEDFYLKSDPLTKTEMTSQPSSGALGSSNPEVTEITKHTDYFDSNETDNRMESESRNPSFSPGAVDAAPSRKSRRMSLADIHSKIRRLSHMINTAPDTIAVGSCADPAPPLEHDMDQNSKDKTKSLPAREPELEMALVNTEESTQESTPCPIEGEPFTATTTPFTLETKHLLSRLSVGAFKPKLPPRSKPDDPKKVTLEGEHTKTITVNVTNQLSNFEDDVSDIYDEELASCEDVSEMLDPRSLQKATEKGSPLKDNVFEEDLISAVHGKKRHLPVDESNMEDEKRMKASIETDAHSEMGSQSPLVGGDSNMTTAPCMTTQTTDESNSSHTASIRCEATFESTFKQSLFESQLEDYASDMQRKFDDGTITVLEFFKIFNIDFVIHNPRQSVLPERLLSDTDRTPMDLLKDKHINRLKQMVYETNVLNLTEKVERLKERMWDLDKPLKTVNRPLWEEIRNSSEKELKSFGAKLKERNNLFRKTSKVQSHEMKEVLYSHLVQANLEEQQKLRGTIEEADEMIKSLDDCIRQLETELAAVKEKGFKGKPSLKSCQEEMKKITEALADNDQQISELEMQKVQTSKKLNRLKAETRNLESHVTTLQMVNEWKFGENRDNCTVYTFLHETFHLQLVFEKPDGADANNQAERKISHIAFKHQLDEEKSQGHACLVHKLLSQYIEGEAAWVEKYPTSRHVPKLLHDVGLVVSRCRLLGEELRLLKMRGGLRLDVLDISCVDTNVHIVFSSLKKFSKFEVIFSVSLTSHFCSLQVQSFKNIIGSTTIQQIEEIVASFSPGKNLLTKIVKKIHEDLLC